MDRTGAAPNLRRLLQPTKAPVAAQMGPKRGFKTKDDIVIVGAVRTPVGAFNGAFGTMPAHELGKIAIKAAIGRAGVEAPRVSEVIMGQI